MNKIKYNYKKYGILYAYINKTLRKTGKPFVSYKSQL